MTRVTCPRGAIWFVIDGLGYLYIHVSLMSFILNLMLASD
jgi:hypothetical protein